MSLIMEVLEEAGVQIKYHGSLPNEILVCCPFCSERGESADTRFRLGINTQKGLAHCYNGGCNWTGHGDVYVARHLARVYGVRLAPQWATAQNRTTEHSSEPPAEHKTDQEPVEIGLPPGYEGFRRDSKNAAERQAREYLESRGISILQIVKHHIGYAEAGPYGYRVLFPVIGDLGKIYGCVGRSFIPTGRPKYLNTPGLKLLWGGHQRAAVGVVVEGIFDALHVEHALLRFHDHTALAQLGSAVTEAQTAQLKKFERVIVMPDFDKPGVKGAIELCKRSAACGIHTQVVIPDKLTGKDPGDLDTQEIEILLRGAVRWGTAAEMQLQLLQTEHQPVE